MTRAGAVLLSAGLLLLAVLLVRQGLPGVLATLALARWGLVLVALFHILPLALDAAAIRVLFEYAEDRGTYLDALLARWAGETANSLLPAGQIGGVLLMVQHLAQRGLRWQSAAAAVTVSTTLQALGQIVFAIVGLLLLGGGARQFSDESLRVPLLVASGTVAVMVSLFYFLQRRGLFVSLARGAGRIACGRDLSRLMSHATAIDLAIRQTHGRARDLTASFLLSLGGWVIGTGEVYLILRFIGAPVSWSAALLLESLGQAIRGASFAIPASLGVQEGGYLLLGTVSGLHPDQALALSLAKRSRELMLGLPGLLYLHLSRRSPGERLT